MGEREQEADSILVVNGQRPSVVVSTASSMFRNRFTVAHELGHYFLHSKEGEIELYGRRSGEDERAEWEANWFAASFLMPQEIFLTKVKELKTVGLLSAYFMVSPEALRIRLKALTEGE